MRDLLANSSELRSMMKKKKTILGFSHLKNIWIHYLEDFYGIRFFFVKVKSLEISLQRFHIIYKRRCEILHNIGSSVGRAIGSDPHG